MAGVNNTQESENFDNTKYKPGVNRNARLSIKNVSFKATEDALKEYFSSFGNVEEVKLLKRPDGKLVGCGFVHFTHVSMANDALKANKKPFLGRPLTVTWAVPKHKYDVQQKDEGSVTIKEEDHVEKKDKNKNKTKINRNARLIIRNISFKATEDSLKEFFEPYGTVQEVELLKKPDGKLVGCAFVSFANVPMAKAALVATNTKPFLGRPISVDWAVAKDKYMRYVVNQQLEMQDAIKKEESDSDDDGEPINITTDDIKDEVKSETNSDSIKSGDSESEDENSDESENDDDEDSDDEDKAENDDAKSETSTQPDRQRLKSNDAEDGCTVFVTNIPFSVDNEQLRQFAEDFAPVKYALVCVDKMTEHSRGSGFVKFTKSEDADAFLSLSADKLRLGGQVLKVRPALLKDNLTNNAKKQPKDNRNLYLVKEGVIVAGTKAAEGVSALDMAKRLALERNKTQMLKNLNSYSSRRVSLRQLHVLWEYLNLNRDIASAYNRSLQAKEYSQRKWSAVTETLNSIGDGAHKDWRGWSKYWVDYKAKLKKRVASVRASRTGTGGGPSTVQPLSEIELNFLGILGDNFGEGLPGIIRVEPFSQCTGSAIDEIGSPASPWPNTCTVSGVQDPSTSMVVDSVLPLSPYRTRTPSPDPVLTSTPAPGAVAAAGVRQTPRRRRRRQQTMSQEAARRALVECSQLRAEAAVRSSAALGRISQSTERIHNTLQRIERFVSRYRLVVSNLPEYCDDARLRAICSKAAGKGAVITEARVMKDLRDPKRPSKGYGFVMFMKHEHALACLRKLNNNPDIFNKINRPIVSFSIEDRIALNARKKRLEKSIANNPLANKSENNSNNTNKSRKRRGKNLPDETSNKKRRTTPVVSTVGQFVRRPNEEQADEYIGLTAKQGSRHNMRSSFKLKKQAEIHRENVKQDKKRSQRAIRMKKAMRERIKLPKQKINKHPNKKRSKRKFN